MNVYKKLMKNSMIFAIANLGSKFLSILLVPFYTYVLSSQEYGQIDMITTTISLILPLATLSIFEATLRFSIKSNYDKSSVLSSSLIVVTIGNVILLLLVPLLNSIPIFKENLYLFYFVMYVQGINSVVSQFTRAIGKTTTFAISGIINTLITLVANIIFLVQVGMGVEGYLLSLILANTGSCIFQIIYAKIWSEIKLDKWNFQLVKQMLTFSIPLIPNTFMWWLMNASDRYIISLKLGLSANGIYAVSNKIPTVLYVINSIFFQAWQLSAIEEENSKEKSKLYTNTFNIFSFVMLIGTSAILIFIKPIITILVSAEFADAWKYSPFLLLAIVFSSFSSFIGASYIAMKETKGVLKTSLLGGISNIILNLILIPSIGLNGAAIATMISFFLVWIIRVYDIKDFIKIKVNIMRISLMIFIIIIQSVTLINEYKYNFIIQLILFIIIIFININIINVIISKVMNMYKIKKDKAN